MFYESKSHHRHRHAGQHHNHHHAGGPEWGGRSFGGRGFGGEGFGGGGFWGRGGGGGFPKGRKLSSADLQIVILALLADKPAHGYELIRALEEKSGAFYTPSPGVIYPALTYLDEIGHAEATPEGKRKLYSITQAGRAYLAENEERARGLLDALGQIASRMNRVREAFDGSEEAGPEREEHIRAIRSLKRALHEKHGCPTEEAKRITEILKRAVDEITAAQ